MPHLPPANAVSTPASAPATAASEHTAVVNLLPGVGRHGNVALKRYNEWHRVMGTINARRLRPYIQFSTALNDTESHQFSRLNIPAPFDYAHNGHR